MTTMEWSTDELSERECDRIVRSVVTPRPIAWVSTVSEEGVDNLAPFSSYNYISSDQPVVVFNSPNEATGNLKDTARNVLETGEFAVNVVTEALLGTMDHTSKRIPSDESEFELAGIERASCRRVATSRVADAVATMECTLYDAIEVHNRIMILGEVQFFHVSEAIMTDGKVDMNKIDTVGRLGGPYYTVSDPVEFERQF